MASNEKDYPFISISELKPYPNNARQHPQEHDTPLTITKEDSCHIRQLDSQKEYDGSAIFGSGFLLSEKAAAEKAAAEKAAAKVWELSDREIEIVKSLGKGK